MQKFCKGGRTWGILKRGRAKLQAASVGGKQCQGEHWKTMSSPTAHKTIKASSCQMLKMALLPDVWQRKLRRISV